MHEAKKRHKSSVLNIQMTFSFTAHLWTFFFFFCISCWVSRLCWAYYRYYFAWHGKRHFTIGFLLLYFRLKSLMIRKGIKRGAIKLDCLPFNNGPGFFAVKKIFKIVWKFWSFSTEERKRMLRILLY